MLNPRFLLRHCLLSPGRAPPVAAGARILRRRDACRACGAHPPFRHLSHPPCPGIPGMTPSAPPPEMRASVLPPIPGRTSRAPGRKARRRPSTRKRDARRPAGIPSWNGSPRALEFFSIAANPRTPADGMRDGHEQGVLQHIDTGHHELPTARCDPAADRTGSSSAPCRQHRELPASHMILRRTGQGVLQHPDTRHRELPTARHDPAADRRGVLQRTGRRHRELLTAQQDPATDTRHPSTTFSSNDFQQH